MSLTLCCNLFLRSLIILKSDTVQYDYIYVTRYVLQSPVMHCRTSLSHLSIYILKKHKNALNVG